MRNTFFDIIFPIIFTLMFVIVLGGFAVSGYLGYECYKSNDPNSTACFMVHSNQQTINLNETRK